MAGTVEMPESDEKKRSCTCPCFSAYPDHRNVLSESFLHLLLWLIFHHKSKHRKIPKIHRRIREVRIMRICEFKQREVINVRDCKRLGFVGDVDFDICTGKMLAIIVPGPGCVWGFLGREKEYIIPFCDICQIGDDIILVKLKEEKEKSNTET